MVHYPLLSLRRVPYFISSRPKQIVFSILFSWNRVWSPSLYQLLTYYCHSHIFTALESHRDIEKPSLVVTLFNILCILAVIFKVGVCSSSNPRRRGKVKFQLSDERYLQKKGRILQLRRKINFHFCFLKCSNFKCA